MDSFLIKGGTPLRGEVQISGAKNAVLPIMAAALLTPEPCVIRRVPNLSDVRFMGEILESLGATVKFEGNTVTIHAAKVKGLGDYELIRKMRGSICILGPLLGRNGKARGFVAGRLRHWRAAHRLASQRAGGAGRKNHDRKRLRQRLRQEAPGRRAVPGRTRRPDGFGHGQRH